MSNSCSSSQLSLGENGFQMVIHRAHANLEQLGHEPLCQPHRLVFKPALQTRAAILRLVENDFRLRQRLVAYGVLLSNRTVRYSRIVARANSGIAGFTRRMASRKRPTA